MKEFNVIEHYFQQGLVSRKDVILGVGDDAALVQVPRDMELAISVDTLVEGVHFPINTCAYDIGYKSLAVNLSDMAAMGATPAWFTLALSCPEINESWLQQFTQGLADLAVQHQVALIGGDTTSSKSAITISIQIMGFSAKKQALQRDKAQIGDVICVTGNLGNAGLGLASVFGEVDLPELDKQFVEQCLNRPTPWVEIGQTLSKMGVQCAIDISDGLLADLGHILTASQVGAQIYLAQIPLSNTLKNQLSTQQAWQFALASGDDYELCFTVSPDKLEQLTQHLPANHFYPIGYIEAEHGLRCLQENGELWQPKQSGYEHFSKAE
ncbi:thiamine-phosphate kinase [Candidatus Albibeggiatoa sp. nov. BB20]|uniref:thiamine-phosphate kinase n=1 Tax=Candidatus Albibeggiatoa sp. nov. BB20 TaxID=3162723 RepID=UPI0033658858